jgi:hypothetical protein
MKTNKQEYMKQYYKKHRKQLLAHKKLYTKSTRYRQLRKIWLNKNKNRYDKQRMYYMAKHYYGITKEVYDKFIKDQAGKCSICNNSRKLSIDHDHKTGKIRGLLCKHCNSSISLFENKKLFKKALEYLEIR